MANINDTYFEGHYKDIWRAIIPEELTRREAEFMLTYFHLKPGQKILDLMCGYGRHAIALARAGLSVVAVDNLKEYIEEIEITAKQRSLPITSMQSGALEFRSDSKFDLALCMGNSLNFFNPSDTFAILKYISQILNPGGFLLINTWSLAEIAYRQYTEESTGQVSGFNIFSTSQFQYFPDRIETETKMVSASGETETKTAIDYIFSINEIENLLNGSGFVIKEIYSIPGRKKFALGDPRAYIIAELKK